MVPSRLTLLQWMPHTYKYVSLRLDLVGLNTKLVEVWDGYFGGVETGVRSQNNQYLLYNVHK